MENSKSANNRTDEAIKQQEKTKQEITVIDNAIGGIKSLADVAMANATAAYKLADDTLIESERLLAEAETPLDKVGANETKGRIAVFCLVKKYKDVQHMM